MKAEPTEHPRPLLRRPWQTLDGQWRFALDSAGADDPTKVGFDRSISVPFAPETLASGVGESTRDLRCWYRRTVDCGVRKGDRLLVHFGAVDRRARVWANGDIVGEHVGGYSPFAVDVTARARRGEVDLVVEVDDDPDAHDVPRGKQEWREEPHGIWYPRTTGIWRTVWVERVPVVHVADVRWVPDARAMTLRLEARVAGPARRGARLHVAIRCGARVLVDDAIEVVDRHVVRTFALGDGGIDDRTGLTWATNRPTLLEANIAVVDASGTILDEVESYTALRTVEVADGRFLLNGRPLSLRLVLDQGYWPDTGLTPPDGDALRRDLELTRALGFDGARKHQKTEDPRYLAWADRMGVLVWAELPSAYRTGVTSAAALLREWAEIVESHRGHPSVVAWVPVNESWGVADVARDSQQQAVVRALAAATDALDGTRPISANDGWETIGGGIVGVHDYTQDADLLRRRYRTEEAVASVVRGRRWDGRVSDIERRMPDGRAVVLSEFGGIALGSEDEQGSWGYDRARDSQDLLDRYRALWAAVHESDGLAGACWTQLTDTYQEVNGLLAFDRTPKAPIEELAAATTGRG